MIFTVPLLFLPLSFSPQSSLHKPFKYWKRLSVLPILQRQNLQNFSIRNNKSQKVNNGRHEQDYSVKLQKGGVRQIYIYLWLLLGESSVPLYSQIFCISDNERS